jgi:hypothetical protein
MIVRVDGEGGGRSSCLPPPLPPPAFPAFPPFPPFIPFPPPGLEVRPGLGVGWTVDMARERTKGVRASEWGWESWTKGGARR